MNLQPEHDLASELLKDIYMIFSWYQNLNNLTFVHKK